MLRLQHSTTAVWRTQDSQEWHTPSIDCYSIDSLTYIQASRMSCQHSTTSSKNRNFVCQRPWGLHHKVKSNLCGRGGHDGELWCSQPFTKVPVSEALWVIADLLVDDDTLRNRTTLLSADIVSLIRLCLTTTYFQFGGDFYEQVEGAAMGSPLSQLVANMCMQDCAQRALTRAPLKPRCGYATCMTPLSSGNMVIRSCKLP